MSPEKAGISQIHRLSLEPAERELTPEFPYSCPNCGANLEQPGAIIAWIEYSEHLVGHIEPGQGDGVNLALDRIDNNLSPNLQCADCGENLEGLVVEEIFLGLECEIEEDGGTEEDDKKE